MLPIFDLRYLMYMIPAIILMLIAQWYVSSAYNHWSQVRSRSGMTGLDAARRLLSISGMGHIRLEGVPGQMTDHYDPQRKVLRLSQSVATKPSVASLAIAAHELGHAEQDVDGYFPLKLRGLLVPAVNIGSSLRWILIMIGLVLNLSGLAWLGIFVFSAGALFALVTLPVELNASARARRMLEESGIIAGEDEKKGVDAVLNAAALTYVAALATSVMQLLYYVSLVGGRDRD